MYERLPSDTLFPRIILLTQTWFPQASCIAQSGASLIFRWLKVPLKHLICLPAAACPSRRGVPRLQCSSSRLCPSHLHHPLLIAHIQLQTDHHIQQRQEWRSGGFSRPSSGVELTWLRSVVPRQESDSMISILSRYCRFLGHEFQSLFLETHSAS